jgi:hypothetical protein
MRQVLLALLVMAGLSACGGADYPECIGALRYGDHTYREVGFTDHKGTMLKQRAEFATCDAVKKYGVSTAFRKGTETVKARSLPGYRAEQVIEVQVTDGAWSVLVSEAAPEQLAQQIRDAGLLNAGEQ